MTLSPLSAGGVPNRLAMIVRGGHRSAGSWKWRVPPISLKQLLLIMLGISPWCQNSGRSFKGLLLLSFLVGKSVIPSPDDRDLIIQEYRSRKNLFLLSIHVHYLFISKYFNLRAPLLSKHHAPCEWNMSGAALVLCKQI